jgi:DNA-binding response OmpR family regulator
VVILDVNLPDGKGEELLTIMKTGVNKLTPVIIFSAIEISAETGKNITAALLKTTTTIEELQATIYTAMAHWKAGHAINPIRHSK